MASQARSITARRSRYWSGVQTQHVFQPSAYSTAVRMSRSPLPPTNSGGRGTWHAGGSTTAWWRGGTAVERERRAAEEAADDVERLAQPRDAAHPRSAS